MQSHEPLPAAWVDRLFARFTAMYGSQKVGAMWADADREEVKGVWAQQLGRFEPPTIAAAIQSLIDSGDPWPPTLPGFVEACRIASIARRQHQDVTKALPAPGEAFTDTETAKANMARVKAMLAQIGRG